MPLRDGFRIIGNIEPLGPAEFVIIASAIPTDPAGNAEVLMEDATSYQEAEAMLKYVMEQLVAQITRRGDLVVDVTF